jgi:hypothetical protein
MLQNGNGKRSRASKTKQPNPVTRLNTGDTEASKPYDPSTEKRRHMSRIESIRQWVNKIGSRQRILRITAINCIPGKGWLIAEVLHSPLAVKAGAVSTTHPGNADPHSQRQKVSCPFNDCADNLVAGYKSPSKRRQVAFNDVQICPAYAAGNYAQQNVTWRNLRPRNLLDAQKPFRR